MEHIEYRGFQLLKDAWDLLSTVNEGDWTAQKPAWRDDAIKFRTACSEIFDIPELKLSIHTEHGHATSATMNYTDAIQCAAAGERIIRTGPGGVLIRAIPCGKDYVLSAKTTSGQWVIWEPCQNDKDAENWVTVEE